MKINSFERLYLHTLKDLYSAENQLHKAQTHFGDVANNTKLEALFHDHLNSTQKQIDRLERICDDLGVDPSGHPCREMQAMIEESKEIADATDIPDNVKDAGLIASAQKMEHYEMASYGTAAHYANMLGRTEDAELLNQCLDEAKAADEKFNDLAINEINQEAMEEQGGQSRSGA